MNKYMVTGLWATASLVLSGLFGSIMAVDTAIKIYPAVVLLGLIVTGYITVWRIIH